MTESAKQYISRAADVAFRNDSKTTMGEVAIAKSNLEIADAIRELAKATDRGAAADEAFAAQSAARRQGPPRPVVQAAPPVRDTRSREDLTNDGLSITEIAMMSEVEVNLAFLIRKVDEDTGFNNIFTSEAVALAKAILKEYAPITDTVPRSEVDTVEGEHERIRKAFADFFQKTAFSSWISSSGRRFEDLGNGWQVGYDLADDVIRGAAKFD